MIIADPIKVLRRLVKTLGSQRAAAAGLGISVNYMSDLINGRRSCSDRILTKLKLRRVIVATRRKTRHASR
jgi:DNA-binding transcriptional regulator YdaS (Cro superfamily)